MLYYTFCIIYYTIPILLTLDCHKALFLISQIWYTAAKSTAYITCFLIDFCPYICSPGPIYPLKKIVCQKYTPIHSRNLVLSCLMNSHSKKRCSCVSSALPHKQHKLSRLTLHKNSLSLVLSLF